MPNITWNDKTVATSPATVLPTVKLRRGDFVRVNNELFKVNTVQTGCIGWNQITNSFVLERRDGTEFGTINLPEKALIFKRKGKVVWS